MGKWKNSSLNSYSRLLIQWDIKISWLLNQPLSATKQNFNKHKMYSWIWGAPQTISTLLGIKEIFKKTLRGKVQTISRWEGIDLVIRRKTFSVTIACYRPHADSDCNFRGNNINWAFGACASFSKFLPEMLALPDLVYQICESKRDALCCNPC